MPLGNFLGKSGFNVPGHFSNFSRMTFSDLLPLGVGLLTGEGSKAALNAMNPYSGVNPSATASENLLNTLDSIEWDIEAIENPVISLWVNPQNISTDKKIVSNKVQTKGGFVIQFWGHDLTEISVKSKTAYFEINNNPLQAFTLLKKHVYDDRFSSTQSFKGMPIISMIWDTQVLQGYFQNFSFSFDSMNPYIINYDFKFTVTQLITVPFVSLAKEIVDSLGGDVDAGSWGIPII